VIQEASPQGSAVSRTLEIRLEFQEVLVAVVVEVTLEQEVEAVFLRLEVTEEARHWGVAEVLVHLKEEGEEQA